MPVLGGENASGTLRINGTTGLGQPIRQFRSLGNPMARYQRVTQEDKWGCGVACIASLLGITYREARDAVEIAKGGRVNARPAGLELHVIAEALRSHGVKVVADWYPSRIPNGTIVFVAGGKRYGEAGHYILKTPKGWMDPWYNLRKARKAEYRADYPRGTSPRVFLVPVRA